MKKPVPVIFLLAMCLVSCAPTLPSIHSLIEYEKTQVTEPLPPSEAPYVIGAGDILGIDVWKEPDLSKQVSVRLDGKISMPLLEDQQAAGLTTKELQDHITEAYKAFVEAPQVSVTVLQSLSRKVYFVGKINRPGEIPLQKNMTVLQAISIAGGLSEWADTSDVRLIRKINGVEQTFRIDYDAIVSGKDLAQNVELKVDDTIFVP
jgi:polysaccharide export outer membrane protein